MSEKIGFFKNHGDTIAIIGVNVAMMAILVTMCISNAHRVDTCNSRIDATLSRIDATMSRIDGMYEVLMNHVKPKSTRNSTSYNDKLTCIEDDVLRLQQCSCDDAVRIASIDFKIEKLTEKTRE